MMMVASRSTRRPSALPIALAVALIALPSAGFSQSPLGTLLRGLGVQPSPASNRALQENEASGDCARLKVWVASVPGATSSRGTEAVLLYTDDEVFARAFGKTYDQVTVEEFRTMQRGLGVCNRQGGFTPIQQQMASTVWNQGTQIRIAPQLAAARNRSSELSRLTIELGALQSTESDYRRLDAIKSSTDGLMRSASVADRKRMGELIDETRTRIGPAVEAERVRNVIATAGDAAGLAALAARNAELARSPLDRQYTEPLREQVRGQIAVIDTQVASTERAAASFAQGGGLPTLERGRGWIADFDRRYESALPDAPALKSLRQDVMSKRTMLIAANEGPLLALIKTQGEPRDLNGLLGRYLLPEEQREGPGRSVRIAAEERATSLQRVARNEAVFGIKGTAPNNIAQAKLKGDFEEPQIVAAVYLADATLLPNEQMFVMKYLLAQAEMIMTECKTIKLSEFRSFETQVAKAVLPRNQDEMMRQGAQNMMGMMTLLAGALQNPQSLAVAGQKSQRVEDAPQYGANDLTEFGQRNGLCGSPPLNQYTRNLRGYFKNIASN